MYCIEIDEWKWQRMEIKGDIKPVGRYKDSSKDQITLLVGFLSCTVIFRRYLTGTLIHKWKLCTLGGTGPDIEKTKSGCKQDPGATYHQCVFKGDGYGLNNEYFEFNLKTSKYDI